MRAPARGRRPGGGSTSSRGRGAGAVAGLPAGLAAWLEANGLAQLGPVFAGHEIDLEVLGQLTEADLRELGISLGARKRFFNALNTRPRDTAMPSSPGHTPTPAVPPATGKWAPEPEYRQLTVMFCDLVNSTRLANRLDPELMSEVLRVYRDCCVRAVLRSGGQVAKFMGDGVVVYFGYPEAHEDDAERAVRAALAIVQAAPGLALPPRAEGPLSVRVGIATGMVVVGELVGTGAAQEQTAVGYTPNLAARLQSLAAPGGIIISARTHRLTGGLFACVDLGEQQLKGFDAPEHAWRVLGPGRAESRFEALRGTQLAPIVGREAELGLLLERWRRAASGAGELVLVTGEPGIGKSRLARALCVAIDGQPHASLHYYCSAHHRNTALYPVTAQFEYAAGIDPNDAPEQKLAKLERLLQQWRAPLSETVPLFAPLLSIPTLGAHAPLAVPPAELMRRTQRSMVGRLEELAAEQPVLAIFEDAHWIDPTSEELIRGSLASVLRLPILLIVTTRPEYDFPGLEAAAQGRATRLPVQRLAPQQAFAVVRQRAEGRALPLAIVEQIVAKADGIPLFLEELTKNVLVSERGQVGTGSGGTAVGISAMDVPETLYDALMARLDQMSTVKQVAQLAAVVGRGFTLALLEAVSDLAPAALREAVDRLVEAEVFYPLARDAAQQEAYAFKHALLQEVAYQSLLRSARQRHHARVARALEERLPAISEAQPELVAHHFTEAGDAPAAIRNWLAAGRHATKRSANLEAIAQLRNGLALLDALPDPAERARQEHALRLAMIAPLVAAKGYTATEIEDTLDRLVHLSEETGDTSGVFAILENRNSFVAVTGRLDDAVRYVLEARRLAERYPGSEGAISAGRTLGSSTLLRGDPPAARPILEQAMAAYDPERHLGSAFAFGQDLLVACASYLSLTAWHLGRIAEALAFGERAVGHARSLVHMNTLCLALSFNGGFLRGLMRDGAAIAPVAGEVRRLAAEHDLPLWQAVGTILAGKADAERERLPEGIAAIQAGIAGLEAIHVRLFRPMFLGWLAAAQLRVGAMEAGLATVADGFAVAEGGEHWMDAELHRLRGEVLLARDGMPNAAEEAERCLRLAHETALAQGSRALQLRAALSLARLLAERGEQPAARALLAPVRAPCDNASWAATRDALEADAFLRTL